MLPLGVSFWDGAGWGLQPGGRGACLSFRPEGVFGSLVEKAGWSVGCSLRGASYGLLPFSAWGSTPPGAAQTPRHLQRHCKRASAGGSADCIRA